ncbi:MAG: hypothetical protein M3535_02260 [Actinomycetota bacterium]|nr:hypothetical protein [Actinomycetota bacterium]
MVDLAGDLLGPSGPEWPEVAVEWVAPLPDPPEQGSFSTKEAVLPLLSGGHAVLMRELRRARFHKPRAADGHELAHPCLSAVGLVFARWDGRIALHAGGVLFEGVAWGVLGEREAGKSTTLAWLAQAGQVVLSDDLLVVEKGQAFCGPRTIDLRPRAAERLEGRDRLVVVRQGERHRMLLPPAPVTAPLGGFLVLGVGDAMTVTSVDVGERLGALSEHLMLQQAGLPAAGLLELVGLPMWRVNRSRAWSDLPLLLDRLRTTVAG